MSCILTVGHPIRTPAYSRISPARMSRLIRTYATMSRVVPQVNPLLSPYQMGEFHLNHRVVYAPLTRCRSRGNIIPEEAALYYSQRTTVGGFLISEATCVSPQGHGYPSTPGVYTDEQVEAWKPVTKAVKDEGGIFFLQLWHVGRASHPDYQPGGDLPVAPSAVAVPGGAKLYTPSFQEADYPVPRAMEKSDIAKAVQEFAIGAKNALKAGFAGVEIHGANGYIVDQFLKAQSNLRTDEYGGSVENRARFAIEVVKAVADAVGKDKVGIRLSPYNKYLMTEIDPEVVELYTYLVEQLSELGILYIHMVEPRLSDGDGTDPTKYDASWTNDPFRKIFKGTFIRAGGYGLENGIEAISSGDADLIAYGRYFLATPDLPERFAEGAPLNAYNRATFYAPTLVEGYTDYPFLADIDASTPVEDKHGVKVFKLSEVKQAAAAS